MKKIIPILLVLLLLAGCKIQTDIRPDTIVDIPLEPTEAVTEAPTEEVTEEPTEAPTVPCQELVLEDTDITLREAGAMHLLNIRILPEDTTDLIEFFSSNTDIFSQVLIAFKIPLARFCFVPVPENIGSNGIQSHSLHHLEAMKPILVWNT